MRFVKYYAGNVAAVGASGRGIGTSLAVGTGVAPAFPRASRLSTSSPIRAATSTQTKRPLPSTASAHFAWPDGDPAALLICQTMVCFAIPSAASPARSNCKTDVLVLEKQKPKSHSACACLPPTYFIAAGFLRDCVTVNRQRALSCLNLWRTHVCAQEQNARHLPDAF